jgi:hypothetical protein
MKPTPEEMYRAETTLGPDDLDRNGEREGREPRCSTCQKYQCGAGRGGSEAEEAMCRLRFVWQDRRWSPSTTVAMAAAVDAMTEELVDALAADAERAADGG